MSAFRLAPRRTVVLLAVAGLAAVSITACDDQGAASTAGAAPTARAASDAGGKTAAAGKTVSAAALCGYLKDNVGEWRAVGSEVGAMAQMTIGLFDFYDRNGAVPQGAEIDEKSKAECPDVRDEVLKAAGIESFTAL
ncbi:hypothetical protein AB0C12_08690 [Actinoplanes sp. NPDC048967]|uniref:hypothetical protein n=1 Tax=Actinoplanes sp. NPDC048967 TaxID=3155269 RepID=UPI003402D101